LVCQAGTGLWLVRFVNAGDDALSAVTRVVSQMNQRLVEILEKLKRRLLNLEERIA